MPVEWTDAELIRLCLEGRADDFRDETLQALRARLKDSEPVRAALRASPHAAWLPARIGPETESILRSPDADVVRDAELRSGLRPAHRVRNVVFLMLGAAVVAGIAFLAGRGPQRDLESNGSAVHDVSSAETQPTHSPDVDGTQTADSRPSEPAAGQPEADSTTMLPADNATAMTPAKPAGTTPPAGSSEAGLASAASKAGTTQPASVPQTEAPRPWSEAIRGDVAPKAVDEVAWLLPGMERPDTLEPDVVKQWLEPLPGRPFGLNEEKIDSRRFTRFDGMARLKAPWLPGVLLRLGMYDVERCSFFVWRGDRGVRFKWHRDLQPNIWAAHIVTRSGVNSPTEDGPLLTSDCGRWQRTNFGSLDLRWENGQLMLARGPVPILQVPLPEMPEEVVIDGRLKLREIALRRSEPLSTDRLDELVAAPGPNQFATTEPGRLVWRMNPVEGTRFTGALDSVAEPPASEPVSSPVVELVSTSAAKQLVRAVVPVPEPGLSEYIFRVEHADPGTGVCLSGADGTPLWLVTWVWDPAAGRTALTLQGQNENRVEERFDRERLPAPWTGPQQWLRLVPGWSSVSLWVSADGEHWGWVGDSPKRGISARHQQVGVFAHPGAERRIRLSHLEVRSLPALASLADPVTREQVAGSAFEPGELLDTGAWLHRVIRTQPKDVDFLTWRKACAIATLKRQPGNELAKFLVSGLLADGLLEWQTGHGDANPARRAASVWHLLSEASLLVDLLDHGRGVQFAQLYHEATRQLALRRSAHMSGTAAVTGHTPALLSSDRKAASVEADLATPPGEKDAQADARRAGMEGTLALILTPFWSHYIPPLTSPDSARIELVSLIESGRDAEARALIDQLCFWNQNGHPHRPWWSVIDPLYPSIAWAELSALRSLGSEEHARRLNYPGRWKTQLTPFRHPLAQPVSKEAYNVMAEFRAAVSGRSFQDACQVIASAGGAHVLGLLPDRQDDRVLIAFPQAVATAMNEYPVLRQAMNEKYGEVGRLRVRQAMQNGDVRAVEAATVQFFGTLAAAESAQWLGDRALAGGRFAEARSWYRRALADFRRNQQVDTAETTALAARLQMVAAMLGTLPADTAAASSASGSAVRPADSQEADSLEALSKLLVPGTSLTLGAIPLDAAQWTALTREINTRAASQPASVPVDQTATPNGLVPASRVPEVRAYRFEVRGRYEGDVGEHAGNSAPADVDWVARQLGLLRSGPLVFINNRFQLSCLDLASGAMKWSQPIGGDHGSAHHWPMLPMIPLDLGDAVVCRRLTKQGPELICCQKDNGTIRWKTRSDQILVSDPFVVRGRLLMFGLRPVEAGPGELSLLTIHRESGTVEDVRPILKLFDIWQNATPSVQVAADDGLIWFVTPGIAGCCDDQGQSLWVRRNGWIPATLDSGDRHTRAWQPPLLSNGRLIVTQPDSPAVDCLDASSGQILWQVVLPERRRLIAPQNGRLLVESRWGIDAIELDSGRTAWTLPATDLLEAVAVSDQDSPAAAALPMPMPGGFQPLMKTPGLLLVRAADGLDNRKGKLVPTLVWVETTQGQEVARCALDGLEDAEPRFGPLLVTPDRLFAFSAKGRREATRDLIELLPDDTRKVTVPASQKVWAGWHPEFRCGRFPDNRFARPELARFTMTETMQRGMEVIAPGWVAIMPPQPNGTGYRAEHRGQKDVLAVRLAPRGLTEEQQKSLADTPIDAFRLFRDVTVPDSADAGLKFKVGHEPGQKWLLTIEVGCDKPVTMIVDDGTGPGGWQQVHFSLARFAGQQARLVITCAPAEPKGETWIMLSGLDESRLPPPQEPPKVAVRD